MHKLTLLFILLANVQVVAQAKINRVILKKGQKIFLERGDYMKDKIYGITEKDDTVQVILADQVFYKFKNGEFEAWAITNQLNEATDIVSNESFESYPFNALTDRITTVYKEGKIGSDPVIDLRKGTKISVISKVEPFYEIEFNKDQTGYVVTTEIPGAGREKGQTHIMRSIFEQMNYGGKEADERYIRTNGTFVSKYSSEGYISETYRVGNTLYTITKYGGKTEISSYVTN